MTTVQEMIRQASLQLKEANVDSPELSARILAEKVLGFDSLGLVIEAKAEVLKNQLLEYKDLVQRRASGEPAAYILGQREFYGLDFEVGPDVLIPRPETEEMVELVQERYSSVDSFVFADFGTGSGILAVTLAFLFSRARGIAFDISSGACSVAQRNAIRHGVSGRIQFVRADFTISVLKDNSLDLLVANPPYLCEKELEEISPEVSEFEPCGALVSGACGDELIRGSAPVISRALKKGAMMFMEIGYLQGKIAKEIFESCEGAFSNVKVLKDLSGHDRMVVAEKQ